MRSFVTEGITLCLFVKGLQNNPNPHAWMSPNNALIYIENIRKALVEHDPDNAAIYNQNAARYAEQIKQRCTIKSKISAYS